MTTFDLNDVQAMRDEYEQRIAVMKKEHAENLAADRSLRQEFIQELTIELASAREEGEVKAMDAEKRRAVAEANLHVLKNQAAADINRLKAEAVAHMAHVRSEVARLEAELSRVRHYIDALLGAPVAATEGRPTTIPHSTLAPVTVPPVTVPPVPVELEAPEPIESTPIDVPAPLSVPMMAPMAAMTTPPLTPATTATTTTAAPAAAKKKATAAAAAGEKKRRIRLR